MLKKSAILGLVLLLVGLTSFGWLLAKKTKEQQQLDSYKRKYRAETDEYIKQYSDWLQLPPEQRPLVPWGTKNSDKTKTAAQLQQQQQEKLKADLDKLSAGESPLYPFADIIYGKNWRNELNTYKKQKELREFLSTSSIVCAFTGGTFFVCCLLIWTARLLIRALSGLKLLKWLPNVFNKPMTAIFSNTLGNSKESKANKSIKDNAKKTWRKSQQELNRFNNENAIEKHSEALTESGWQNPLLVRRELNLIGKEAASPKQNKSFFNNWNSKREKTSSAIPSTKNSGKIPTLLTDEKSIVSRLSPKTTPQNVSINSLQPESPESIEPEDLLDITGKTFQPKDSLKNQAENLEKQIAELSKIAKNVQVTAVKQSKPIDDAIKELAQQVSAIREYASCQQGRLEKLQDGYDWNIIRTFCLRIIHSIDNLESRIDQLSKEGIETAILEEVRDELLFALESSGVEQFEPQINSVYRGQEKSAEATKEKQYCDDPKKAGKIAKIIKPGYQYLVSDDNVKVVRTAKVKLYG